MSGPGAFEREYLGLGVFCLRELITLTTAREFGSCPRGLSSATWRPFRSFVEVLTVSPASTSFQ